MCKGNIGVTQELGRSCHLHINHRVGVAVNSKLPAGKNRIQLVGANRMQLWYRGEADILFDFVAGGVLPKAVFCKDQFLLVIKVDTFGTFEFV